MGLAFLNKVKTFFTYNEEEILDDVESEKPRWKGRLVSLTASRHNAIVLMQPSTVQEAQEVGDHLKNRAAVLINLQGLERETAMRILDFTSGIAYALSGGMQKISEAIFLFAPPSVTVISEVRKPNLRERTPETLFSKVSEEFRR